MMPAIPRRLLLPGMPVVAACAATGAMCAGTAAWAGAPLAGLAAGTLLAGAAWLLHGRVAGLVAAAPLLALVPGGGPLTAAAAGAAATMAVLAWTQRAEAVEQRSLRPLRNELRDAEHEREILARHLERTPALQEACLELSAAREVGALAAALVRHARALVPECDEVVVHLGDAQGLRICAGGRRGGAFAARPPDDRETYVAHESRSLLTRSDGVVVLMAPLRGERRSALAGAPDAPGGHLRGVMTCRLRVGAVGDRLHLELLAALARLGGLGLSAVELLEQARLLALTDELTGLLGRVEFLRRLDEAVAGARRHGHALAVIMCDLDHLKRFNDTHGHPAGDRALQAVAKALGAALPAGGSASRFGGEEFAAVLPVADAADACAAAERVRAAVKAAPVEPQRVTASLGVAVLLLGEDGRAALGRADAALYTAKANGRDRVEMAP